jgi:hypothetical protein
MSGRDDWLPADIATQHPLSGLANRPAEPRRQAPFNDVKVVRNYNSASEGTPMRVPGVCLCSLAADQAGCCFAGGLHRISSGRHRSSFALVLAV